MSTLPPTGTKVIAERVVDKRIEPQPNPVYISTVGPQQNQYYRINASGKSNSYITFNNLTTLGADRAYLDTFELEITARVRFTCHPDYSSGLKYVDSTAVNQGMVQTDPITTVDAIQEPNSDLWTFDSFPFNKCCEEIRVNVNGGAFFSTPLTYLRAKERYWDEKKINDAYGNICPCNKPWAANEMGITNSNTSAPKKYARVRLWGVNTGYAVNSTGPTGSSNNDSFVPPDNTTDFVVYPAGAARDARTYEYTVTWREPIFCSPFSSKIDDTYGRPLYNITSLDIAFNLQNLTNMIRCVADGVQSYDVDLQDVNLLYQVMTLPPTITRPVSTVVPYRRFVPYVTEHPNNDTPGAFSPAAGGAPLTTSITSGVYTLNEIPTAIWVFIGTTKNLLQNNPSDGFDASNGHLARGFDVENWIETSGYYATNGMVAAGVPDPRPTPGKYYQGRRKNGGIGYSTRSLTWSFNKTFCPIDKISINCANTTQILNTATPADLYRIAKANGCQDSFTEWNRDSFNIPHDPFTASGVKTNHMNPNLNIIDPTTDPNIGFYIPPPRSGTNFIQPRTPNVSPVGSVLRLIPGTDIVLPDQQLIPGANGNNTVFQVSVDFRIPDGWPANYRKFALWVLFEYVGVATITPGQCQIEMNPLGSGFEVMQNAPIVSATTQEKPSTVEGSGWLDTLKHDFRAVNNWLKENKVLSTAASLIPDVGQPLSKLVSWAGYGAPAKKRAASGGAVMGYGDFC